MGNGSSRREEKRRGYCSLLQQSACSCCGIAGKNNINLPSVRTIDDCKRALKDDFSIDASDHDCEVVRRVCEAVSTRAARLAASGVVALVKKINKLDGCSVAVDGSLYKLHPKFPERYICVLRICHLRSSIQLQG